MRLAQVPRQSFVGIDLLGQELWRLPITAPYVTHRATARERALVASYRGPGRGYTSQLATVIAVTGTRERLSYLRALARPQPDYLLARGSSPLAYLRKAARQTWESR